MSDGKIEKDVLMDLSDKDNYTTYNEYSSCVNGVFYYQNQQIDLRTIGIKILLGTFAFLGYLYFYNIGLDKLSINILSSLLPLLSFFWMIIIMKNDLIYREGLKIGFFDAAIDFEKKHRWIPSFHSCLISETASNHNPGMRQGMFYFISLIILLGLSLLGITQITTPSFSFIKPSLISIVFILFIIYIIRIASILKKISSQFTSLDTDQNYDIIDPNSRKKMFISMLHSKGREYIEHYSSIKMKYKNLVLIVITGLIAGLSYSASIKTENIHINHIYINSFIVTMAVVGISLIRFLDLNISHRQIKLLFDLLIDIESRNSFLASSYIKVNQILYEKKATPVFQDFMYYSAINLSLIILGTLFVILNPHMNQSYFDIVVCLIVFGIFLLWELTSCALLFREVKKNRM